MARKKMMQPHAIPLPTRKFDAEQDLLLSMQRRSFDLRQRNLRAAVFLAFQAFRGEGPLIDHFAAPGRNYLDEARAFECKTAEPERPALRVIEGGAK